MVGPMNENHEVKIKKLEKHKGNVEERAHGLYKSMRIAQPVYKLKLKIRRRRRERITNTCGKTYLGFFLYLFIVFAFSS